MCTRSPIPFLLVAALLASVPAGATPTLGPERVISNQDFDEYLPQVAHNSVRDEYLIVWHDVSVLQPRSVMGKRVDRTGNTIEEFIIAFEDNPPKDNAQPTVAYDPVNNRYFIAWVRDYFGDGSDWDVYGRIIPWDGPSASFPALSICAFGSHQWNPRVAYAGTPGEFLVTWWNEGSGGVHSYISAQRISSAGGLLGSNFLVTSGGEERVAPDVAYNRARNEYLIVYQLMDAGMGDIFGVRISGSGAILGGGDFGIAAWPDPETMPRVAASRVADEWAVVWQSDVPGAMKDVYARRVWINAGGTMEFAAPVQVSATSMNDSIPDIAAHPDRSEYLMAWQIQYASTHLNYGVWARTLNNGNLMGAQMVLRHASNAFDADSLRPEIAASPSDWFVVWEQDRQAVPSYQDIHGRLVIGPMFADGFETGDVSVWDSHLP